MGDISRHRDIFLNTRGAIPRELLSSNGFAEGDLTYLELGNYLTDVSQFRDPVFYIFAKQGVWRDEILPGVDDDGKVVLAKALAHLGALAGAAALASAEGSKRFLAPIPLALSPLLKGLNNKINDAIADALGIDDWLDRMLGKPIEKLDADGKRKPEDFGYVGQFFRHFVEGVSHMLFSQGVTQRVKGEWGTISAIPETDLAKVFETFYTQYFPHEHTDQPPYVWDASERPAHPKLYGPGPRRIEKTDGIMNIVYEHYIGYLAEGLSTLENDWRKIPKDDQEARRFWLVKMGKLLHGVEDWYFHSNVVELIRLHAKRPGPDDAPDAEDFVRKFVQDELSKEPEYVNGTTATRVQLQRFLYRRLRFPVYGRGTRENSGGIASTRESTLSMHHVYPAFPSQQDSAHTLLGALENLERKATAGSSDPGAALTKEHPWVKCLLEKFSKAGPEYREVMEKKAAARGFSKKADGSIAVPDTNAGSQGEAFVTDVLREFVPLVLTLLHQRERQRLVADVPPEDLATDGSTPKPPPGVTPGKRETENQVKRHENALKPKKDAQGVEENNYARAARYMGECGFLNPAGVKAIVAAFEIDMEAEKSNSLTPGSGGFLIQFAVKLQRVLEKATATTERLNRGDPFTSVATDNGSDNETIGCHSLMSKDTKESSPFFDDARVISSVASQSVLHLMLRQISSPATDRLDWQKILRYFIRFPLASGGWERQAMAHFLKNGRKIPAFADLPELAELSKARLTAEQAAPWQTGKRAADLRQMYVDLERKLSRYRYP